MYRQKKILEGLMIIFLMMSSFVVCSQGVKNTAFQDGEQLNYTGYYNWGMIWVKAGKVAMSTQRTVLNGSDVYKIKAIGHSLSGWDWFFRLRDTFEVYCDTARLLPLKFNRIVHEGKYHANYKYKFDYNRGMVFSKIKRGSRPLYRGSKLLFSGTHDMLSFAWYARNLDYSNYKVGQKIGIRLLISNRIYNLYIRYKGIDVVETRDGTEVECHKFSPMLVKGSMFKGGEDMTVWVSNDKNRVPIMAEAKVIIGNVKGVLSSYKGLRHKTNVFLEQSGNMDKK